MSDQRKIIISINNHIFEGFQYLYQDPGYLTFNYGGINSASIEVNLVVANISSGFSNSPSNFLKKKLLGTVVNIGDVCERREEVVVVGYV
ncbi:MAG TPA: hypothetical protein VFS21_15120, partial [Roseiflexaceae bacterium]|nr:hypothetical protein [Roseiflexaceae bacterium]